MRLTRPTFGTEFAFNSSKNDESWDLDTILNFEALTLGECLILPQSFGSALISTGAIPTFPCTIQGIQKLVA